jgi:hypothetical protein
MNIWGDLKDPKWMYLKAILFLVAGVVAAAALLVETPTLRTAFLLGVVIWSFCRLYYFLFYVVEKYIDPSYRFASITSFLLYLIQRRRMRADGGTGGATDSARERPSETR